MVVVETHEAAGGTEIVSGVGLGDPTGTVRAMNWELDRELDWEEVVVVVASTKAEEVERTEVVEETLISSRHRVVS